MGVGWEVSQDWLKLFHAGEDAHAPRNSPCPLTEGDSGGGQMGEGKHRGGTVGELRIIRINVLKQ